MPAISSTPILGGNSLINDAIKAADEAKRANEQRYKSQIRTLQSGGRAALDELRNAGLSRRQDLRRDLQRAQGGTLQSAISRGLSNTTILDALQRGNQETYNRGMNDLASQLAALRTNQINRNTENLASAIYARNDVAPNLPSIAEAIRQAAANQPAGVSVNPLTSMMGVASGNQSSSGISGGAPAISSSSGAFGSSPFSSGGGGGSGGNPNAAVGGYFGPSTTPVSFGGSATRYDTPAPSSSTTGGYQYAPSGTIIIKDNKTGKVVSNRDDLVYDPRSNMGLGGYITRAQWEKYYGKSSTSSK
jgi:hypothetical protein